MSADSVYSSQYPQLVDLFDEFLVSTTIPYDSIQVPIEHQPPNPELEDEVPNQEAVNGIARAKKPREPAWRDLGLQNMIHEVPNNSTNLQDQLSRLAMAHQSSSGSVPARTMR